MYDFFCILVCWDKIVFQSRTCVLHNTVLISSVIKLIKRIKEIDLLTDYCTATQSAMLLQQFHPSVLQPYSGLYLNY